MESKPERELPSGWQLKEGHHLEKEYRFENFAEALAFVNRVGKMADEVDHHPDVYLAWGKARIQVWTHTKNGVTDKDYDFARRVEALGR